jgi:peptidoglycan/LPS O-acetylase OafA/YrhL
MALFLVLSLCINLFHIQPLTSISDFAIPDLNKLILGTLFVSVILNGSFWTLCNEMRWYFIFPLLIIISRRISVYGMLFVVTMFSLVFTFGVIPLGIKPIQQVFSYVPLYLPLFGLGILAAYLVANGLVNLSPKVMPALRIGLLATLALVCLLLPHEPYLDLRYLRAIPFGLLYFGVVLAATCDPIARSIFSWPPLVWVGSFSYSLYLIHLPFIHAAFSVTKQFNWSPAVQFIFYIGFFAPLMVMVGYGFYLVAEKPFLQGRRPLVEKPLGTP